MKLAVRSGTARARVLWLALAVAAVFGGIAVMPGADPASFATGIPEVSAAASPNLLWLSARETAAISSIKATAVSGTPATSGPSANIGQTIQIKGAALAPGAASFVGYNGTPVTSPLTSVKVGKKGKAAVPPLAITGEVSIVPNGGVALTGPRLQIVPTIASLSATTVTAGDALTINGTGFDPTAQVRFPGVAAPVVPSQLDADSAIVTVPVGVQKGKVVVVTSGGTSLGKKLKVAAGALANRALATDPGTGYVLATDDVENTLSAIDPASGQVVRTAAIEPDVEWIRVLDGTRIVALGNDSGATMYFDLAAWAPYHMRGADAKSSTARGNELLVDRDRGVVDDPAAGWSLALGPYVEFAKATADGRYAVAIAGDTGTLYVIDTATRSVATVHRFDGPVEGVTVGLDGRAYTIERATGRLLSVPIE